jgi:large exoprotein involved in heme utilization and adhesion
MSMKLTRTRRRSGGGQAHQAHFAAHQFAARVAQGAVEQRLLAGHAHAAASRRRFRRRVMPS